MQAHRSVHTDPWAPLERTDDRGPEFAEAEARYAGLRPALVVIGDSLAVMWNEKELARLGLQPIAKLGVNGDLTQNMLWRLENSAIDFSATELFIVIAGTNNLSDGYPPADIFRGLTALVQLIGRRAPGAKIAVLQPPPRLHRRRYRPEHHEALNALILQGAAANGFVAVQAPAFDPTDETLYRDGVHLFRRAYKQITQRVAEAIGVAAT